MKCLVLKLIKTHFDNYISKSNFNINYVNNFNLSESILH